MLHWTVHLKGPNRHLHAAVAVRGKVYSFGGFCAWDKKITRYMYATAQIEVQVFNTVSLRWIRLPPVTACEVERPLEVPSMRDGHTVVLIEDVIYIWGGYMHSKECCNVLYAFDVNTHCWLDSKISGAVPEPRCGHSACALGKVMYIFGGFNKLTKHTYNDIHKFDTTTMAWSMINARGTPAPVSECHSATIIGTKMFIFGGTAHQIHINYNNIRVFDTESNLWLNMSSAQLLPEGRACHSAFAYNGELYVFGGSNFLLNRSFNDLWKFSPDTLSWRKVEPKGERPCWMCRMCCCMVGDLIILFGGYRYRYTPEEDENEPEMSDLYILGLNPSLKTLCKIKVIQYGLELSVLPHDISWELAAMTTNRKRKTPMTAADKKTKSPLLKRICV